MDKRCARWLSLCVGFGLVTIVSVVPAAACPANPDTLIASGGLCGTGTTATLCRITTSTASQNLGPNCTLNFSRAVEVVGTLAAARIGGNANSFAIVAPSVNVNGGLLRATGANPGDGGDITLTLTGAFTLSGSSPRVNVNAPGGYTPGNITVHATGITIGAAATALSAAGGDGGAIILDAGTGNLVVNGNTDASGTNSGTGGSLDLSGASIDLNGTIDVTGGDGGSLTATTAGSVSVDGATNAKGANGGEGGTVTLSGSTVTVTQTITVTGGDFGSGTIEINASSSNAQAITVTGTGSFAAQNTNQEAGGTVTLSAAAGGILYQGSANLDGDGEEEGGEFGMSAHKTITTSGTVTANGGTALGDGGAIAIATDDPSANIVIGGALSAKGNGGGTGGGIDLGAGGNLTVQATLDVTGNGSDEGDGGDGGEIDLDAGGTLQTSSLVNANATGDAGTIFYHAVGNITVSSNTWSANGSETAGSIARFGTVVANTMTITGSLQAKGTASVPGGSIDLGSHCTITVTAAGSLNATGSTGTGSIVLRAGTVTVSGTATPTPSTPSTPGACCGNGTVNAGEQCDDSNRLHCDGCSATCQNEPSPVCNDGNPCTTDSCNPTSGCVFTPQTGTSCTSDGNVCTNDVCSAGTCTHPAVTCPSDGVACTVESCTPGVGCVSTPNNAACNDNNTCTSDTCTGTGCSFTPVTDGTACSDGSVCTTGQDTCQSGTCVGAGPNLVCNDGDPCTDDSCNPGVGCLYAENSASCPCTSGGSPLPAGTHCANNDWCTANDQCDGAGNCVAGPPRSCDDGNGCTTDFCIFTVVCVHVDTACAACGAQPDGTPCSDNNACTTGQCSSGTCVSTPITCGDGDICNGIEQCVTGPIGCVTDAPHDGASCDDGDVCTTDDVCSAGSCAGGDAVDCDDDDPCTNDSCDPESGCQHTPNEECGPAELVLVRTVWSPRAPYGVRFGGALGRLGSNVLVGAPEDAVEDGLGGYIGMAGRAYAINPTTGDVEHILTRPTPAELDTFGFGIANIGDDALVGAFQEDVGSVANAGGVYLFDGSTGDLVTTLYSASPIEGGGFGYAVASDGTDALVCEGALPGIHEVDVSTGSTISTFAGPSGELGSASKFTYSLAVVGDFLAAGSGEFDRVLIYDRATNTLERTIQEPYPEVFGYGIRASGSDLLVGGWSGSAGTGNVYRFDPATGDLLQTIANPDETSTNFGFALEVVGDRIVVSAPDSPNACLFVFGQDGTLQQSLPCPSATSAVFGWTMQALGNSVVVSAPYGDEGIFIYAPCGDGNVDPGEACDDGNRDNGDGCSDICQTE